MVKAAVCAPAESVPVELMVALSFPPLKPVTVLLFASCAVI